MAASRRCTGAAHDACLRAAVVKGFRCERAGNLRRDQESEDGGPRDCVGDQANCGLGAW